MLEQNLLLKIENKIKSLSKGQKKLANFIIENYDKDIFTTASKLGKAAGVSESTVIRFSMEMGFDGYNKFKNQIEMIVKNSLTANQRIKVSAEQISKSNKDILTNVLEKDSDRIKYTLNNIDKKHFEEAVNKLLTAKKVYILGVRSSDCLSSFLSFYLNFMLDNVVYLNSSITTDVFEQIFRIEEGDVFVGISFPRYSKRTVRAMEYAYSKNATTIAITDNFSSPLIKFATNSLLAKSDMVSFIDSLVAPLSLINAILVSVSIVKKEKVLASLETLENMWKEYQVYNYDREQNFFR